MNDSTSLSSLEFAVLFPNYGIRVPASLPSVDNMMSTLKFDIPAIILILTCLGCVDYSDDGEMASQPLSPTPRLDQLMDNPPKDMTDEEVVAEILTYYPRIGRSPSFQEYETIHQHAKKSFP